MSTPTPDSPKWKRMEGNFRPPFIGELIQGGKVARRAIVSYTTLDAAIWAAQAEGFNRVVNGKSECASTRGGNTKPR